ncbi:mucin-6-like [Aplysia californica]|uniref:Mucin-6-like n=1 Tax=Aplysia californica TaxID=6500 RepID=A0ABM0KAM6_APLCA|nr:mucin-6-like [Aplysia californica]
MGLVTYRKVTTEYEDNGFANPEKTVVQITFPVNTSLLQPTPAVYQNRDSNPNLNDPKQEHIRRGLHVSKAAEIRTPHPRVQIASHFERGGDDSSTFQNLEDLSPSRKAEKGSNSRNLVSYNNNLPRQHENIMTDTALRSPGILEVSRTENNRRQTSQLPHTNQQQASISREPSKSHGEGGKESSLPTPRQRSRLAISPSPTPPIRAVEEPSPTSGTPYSTSALFSHRYITMNLLSHKSTEPVLTTTTLSPSIVRPGLYNLSKQTNPTPFPASVRNESFSTLGISNQLSRNSSGTRADTSTFMSFLDSAVETLHGATSSTSANLARLEVRLPEVTSYQPRQAHGPLSETTVSNKEFVQSIPSATANKMAHSHVAIEELNRLTTAVTSITATKNNYKSIQNPQPNTNLTTDRTRDRKYSPPTNSLPVRETIHIQQPGIRQQHVNTVPSATNTGHAHLLETRPSDVTHNIRTVSLPGDLTLTLTPPSPSLDQQKLSVVNSVIQNILASTGEQELRYAHNHAQLAQRALEKVAPQLGPSPTSRIAAEFPAQGLNKQTRHGGYELSSVSTHDNTMRGSESPPRTSQSQTLYLNEKTGLSDTTNRNTDISSISRNPSSNPGRTALSGQKSNSRRDPQVHYEVVPPIVPENSGQNYQSSSAASSRQAGNTLGTQFRSQTGLSHTPQTDHWGHSQDSGGFNRDAFPQRPPPNTNVVAPFPQRLPPNSNTLSDPQRHPANLNTASLPQRPHQNTYAVLIPGGQSPNTKMDTFPQRSSPTINTAPFPQSQSSSSNKASAAWQGTSFSSNQEQPASYTASQSVQKAPPPTQGGLGNQNYQNPAPLPRNQPYAIQKPPLAPQNNQNNIPYSGLGQESFQNNRQSNNPSQREPPSSPHFPPPPLPHPQDTPHTTQPPFVDYWDFLSWQQSLSSQQRQNPPINSPDSLPPLTTPPPLCPPPEQMVCAPTRASARLVSFCQQRCDVTSGTCSSALCKCSCSGQSSKHDLHQLAKRTTASAPTFYDPIPGAIIESGDLMISGVDPDLLTTPPPVKVTTPAKMSEESFQKFLQHFARMSGKESQGTAEPDID